MDISSIPAFWHSQFAHACISLHASHKLLGSSREELGTQFHATSAARMPPSDRLERGISPEVPSAVRRYQLVPEHTLDESHNHGRSDAEPGSVPCVFRVQGQAVEHLTETEGRLVTCDSDGMGL